MKTLTTWMHGINNKFLRKKPSMTNDERVLCQIGALTVIELTNSREFRRKIEKTTYGQKLKNLVKY
jgi:hypothetical protein